ncbi:hypothetical protein F5X96DRAFT_140545 [Biscogniauxia mediterranea]|nr:hypothetical protein F5X96DRAFT_140545 [Biscogniauxia mediterranea]
MDGLEGFSTMDNSWSMKNLSWANNSSGLYQAAFAGNSTFGVINEFKFLAARSIRTSTIILAAFNTVSAFATAAGIFFDSYMAAKRSYPPGKGRVNIFTCVRGPELYPFFLSLGITIQGIIFAVSQSEGLEGLFIAGCTLISQFMWPAIFIVPYIQLVFGIEITLRAVRKRPFPSRGKWDVTICLTVISVFLLITGLVGFFIEPPSFCFASLFWFVAKWAEGGFVLLLGIAVVLAVCVVILSLQLTRYATIDPTQRVGASRMVYYLLLAVVSNALMAPFFIYLTFSSSGDGTGLTLSMIATVVANVSGLMTGCLHLFLRSHPSTTIGASYKLAEYERQKLKYQIRVRGPSEMDFNGHMLQPVSGPQYPRKTESQESLVDLEKNDIQRGNDSGYEGSPQDSPNAPNPLGSNAVFGTIDVPRAPEPAQVPASSLSNIHGRRPSVSYRLFPNKDQNNTNTPALLPSTTYSPNTNMSQNAWPLPDLTELLVPPPSIRAGGRGHRRDSSLASSATVQIGLRLSNVNDMPRMTNKDAIELEDVYTLDCCDRLEAPAPLRPSPLANADNVEDMTPISRPQSPAGLPGLGIRRDPATAASSQADTSEIILNPTVYDPNSPTRAKVPSPRGVGFSMPRRVNTTPVQSAPTTPPPPRTRGNSTTAKVDWI